MAPAGLLGLFVTAAALAVLATWQASSDETRLRLIYPITLREVLNGGRVPCPSVPVGYVPSQAAVSASGYDHGIYHFDSRVDISICDETTRPIARMARNAVLGWWINVCDFDARFIGTIVRFEEGRRYVRLTRSLFEQGCDGLDDARRILASDQS